MLPMLLLGLRLLGRGKRQLLLVMFDVCFKQGSTTSNRSLSLPPFQRMIGVKMAYLQLVHAESFSTYIKASIKQAQLKGGAKYV